MITSLLLNASEVPAAIVEALPLVLVIVVLGPIIYLGLILIFIRSKSPAWRLSALAVAFAFAFIGIQQIRGYGNELVILNILFFLPVLVGVVTEYLVRKKQPAV